MFSLPQFAFDDYSAALPGHHLVSRCTEPLDFKWMDAGPYAFVTADDAGKLQQHFVLRQDVVKNLKHLEADFAHPVQDTVLREYPVRLASHMGIQPQVTNTAKGIIYSFPLPEHVCLKPGALEKIRLGDSTAAGVAAYTAESSQWLKQMRLMQSNFHAEHLSDIVTDIVRQLPPMPMHEMLQKSALLENENTKKLQKYFREHPDALSELEQKLKDAHIDPKFQLAGNGRNGVFLKAGDVVVSIRGGIFNEYAKERTLGQGKPLRQPIPQHVQHLAYFNSGPLNIEITPALEVKNLPVSELDRLVESVAQTPHKVEGRQWHFNDPVPRNVGSSAQGTKYVLDGNAIGEAEDVFGFKIKPEIPSGWLNADGTWKQYTEFKPLHERFNSPLHQAEGKLVDYAALEQAAKNNKAKWIIGGVAIAGITIAGIVAAIRHKKSHVEALNERRQNRHSEQIQPRIAV